MNLQSSFCNFTEKQSLREDKIKAGVSLPGALETRLDPSIEGLVIVFLGVIDDSIFNLF